MVDIHCHILPGIDDGSKSWEMTAEMCRIAAEDGVTHIVATPHCNDEFDYNRERYTGMLAELSDVAQGALTFSIGCDFHFSYDNIVDALDHPQRYTIADSQYLLVEFSDYSIAPTVNDQLLQISSRGMVPIITHPERNPLLMKRPELVLRMVEQGCLVQVTANAITGGWGSRPQKMAEWLLQREAVHVIASDAHDPKHRRPVLSSARAAVAKLAGQSTADALVIDNPAAIVSGQPVPRPTLFRAG